MENGSQETENPSADFIGGLFSKKHGEKSNTSSESKQSLMIPSPYAEVYNMNHPRRGLALIFNHVTFAKSQVSRREGSDKDRDDLAEVLRGLDFDVVVHNDLRATEIEGVLITAAKMDHSMHDCLLIAVMSHGDNGTLYARDRIYPTKVLWAPFTANNCPSLAGKPKLFFIQACRGAEVHPGSTLTYSVAKDSINQDEATYSIPILADILLMYSTVAGFFSWRDPKNGSYFIQALVKNLKENHEERDLLTILTFVNRDVAVDFTSYDQKIEKMSGTKQMCSIVSMLTRLVYFNNRKALRD